MPNEEDVKALAEELGEVKIYKGRGLIKHITMPDEREALARRALEFAEKKLNNPWRPYAQFLKRAGVPPVGREEKEPK